MPNIKMKRGSDKTQGIQEADDDLSLIFCAHPVLHPVDPNKVLTILKKYPHFAREKFLTYEHGYLNPLHSVLSSSNAPTLKQVQDIHKMNTLAIQARQGKDKNTALHLVCGLHVDDPAIAEFVFSRCPSALTIKNAKRISPLDSLLESLRFRQEKLPIFNMLLDLCPGCLDERSGTKNPLISVMRSRCSSEVLLSIVKRYPEHWTKLDFSEIGFVPSPSHIDIICNIMPKLKSLTFPSSYRSMKKMLDCVAKNQSIQNLSLNWFFGSDNHEDNCIALRLMLVRNKHLKSLQIDCTNVRTENLKLFLCNLLSGLAANEVLENLFLDGFNFPSLEGKSLTSSILDLAGISTSTQLKSGLRKLKLRDCLGNGTIPYFPELLSLLPSVKYLSIHWNHDLRNEIPSRTDAVVSILNQGKLEKLSVRGCRINLGRICECLRSDTTLKSLTLRSSRYTGAYEHLDEFLQMLAEGNTTLEKVDVFPSIPSRKLQPAWREKKTMVHDYVNLNKYGRGLVRNPNSSRNDFVECLCRVANEYKLTERNKHILQFDLLKEVPGLWASLSG